MAETGVAPPRTFVLLTACVAFSGLVLFVLSWRAYPPALSLQLILVVAGAVFSELFAFELPSFTFSLAYPLAMSAVVIGGPAASGLVAAFSAVTVSDIRRHKPILVLVFNTGQLLTVACLGGWSYVLFGGRVLAAGAWSFSALTAGDFPGALIGMCAAAAVVAVMNLVLISAAVSLLHGERFMSEFVSSVSLLPTQLALAFVGFLMAEVLAVSAIALPLFIFPLVIARQLHQRYVALKAAYADTIRSLVGALEAKDPYTRGHSERVAGYALSIGRSMGLDARALEKIEYSALLHDLGKLAVPRTVLTKPSGLTEAESEAVRVHPARGAEMVAKIPPLRDLAVHVGMHHERFGGGGYPLGISAPDISQTARILSVADCYDAMTTTRAYRRALTHPEAVNELLAGSGGQFDPEIVRAFVDPRPRTAGADVVVPTVHLADARATGGE